jgi:ubiquitin-protein ligase
MRNCNRILREISSLHSDGFDPVLINDNYISILVSLKGPDDSPYSQGLFTISVEIESEYPLVPPKLTFKTRVCHPNIHFEV